MAVEPLSCSAALTHHWLVRLRGGEKVLEAIAELLPRAAVYTLIHDASAYACSDDVDRPPSATVEGDAATRQSEIQNPKSKIANLTVHTSALQRFPGVLRHYPKMLPLMPWAARRMRLPPVELVVCSDAAIAKAMTPDPRSRVVCYCHSPMRYVWEPEISAQYASTLPAPLRPLWPRLCAYLRRADLRGAERVDQFIANSKTVAERIHRHYGRDSVVIHPPVELPDAPATQPREDFYLCVGYHVAYKRLDLAIEACRMLRRRLIVIGGGPEAERLARESPPDANAPTFLGFQPDAVVHDHYRRARGLLFPGEEDFGMVPVEAMGHGCPVIAYARGGAGETVSDGRTGILFDSQTVAGLCSAIERHENLRFDTLTLHEQARRFGHERFLREMREALVAALQSPSRERRV